LILPGHFFSKILRKLKYWKFIYSSPITAIKPFKSEENQTLLVTIAFNEAALIETQIELLRKYFKDPFTHIIVDNSTDFEKRASIREICLKNQVGYLGVPPNPYTQNKSHAAAMHWAYFQLVKKSKCSRFGFLDHDIFPIGDFSIKDKMEIGLYGRVMHAYFKNGYLEKYKLEIPYWSLWAGYCFFDRKRIQAPFPWSMNFFSKHFKDGFFLDTGGGLWDSLYSKTPYPGPMASYRVENVLKNDSSEIQNQSFEILDESWVHFVSLSNWREITDLDKKKSILLKMLKSALH
jgi:hypothetical protein